MKKRKISQEHLEEIIQRGHPQDVEYLLASIVSYRKESLAFHGLRINSPKWSTKDCKRLESWLEELGFSLSTLGKQITFKFGQSDVSFCFILKLLYI